MANRKPMTTILIIAAAAVLIMLAGAAYYGAFTRITFRTETQGGETFVYEELTGEYKQAGALVDKVHRALLDEEKITATKGAGIYYDDPGKVEKSKLRADIGCFVEGQDAATLARLSAKYKVKTIPRGPCLVIEFPYRGKLSMLFEIFKVYPALKKHMAENNLPEGPVMEIYDMPNHRIIIRKPTPAAGWPPAR